MTQFDKRLPRVRVLSAYVCCMLHQLLHLSDLAPGHIHMESTPTSHISEGDGGKNNMYHIFHITYTYTSYTPNIPYIIYQMMCGKINRNTLHLCMFRWFWIMICHQIGTRKKVQRKKHWRFLTTKPATKITPLQSVLAPSPTNKSHDILPSWNLKWASKSSLLDFQKTEELQIEVLED